MEIFLFYFHVRSLKQFLYFFQVFPKTMHLKHSVHIKIYYHRFCRKTELSSVHLRYGQVEIYVI
ncbi:hypothetical protein MBAV_002269 [Candidatus Magnetobacterium bavaricum]|uniref:Uncharacterized protein n=1 Tax=Candidatus Magnetobacterium bavaricum TaxID=29290 RepID=A0A0F3GUL5_9BACT|nr:hypothetical protein MBAV_002269 [Candidatus Magnetobacterium bavaricum]